MKFSPQEDTQLRRLFKANLSGAQIGKIMGRHKGSVNKHITYLGLRGGKEEKKIYSYAYRTPADVEFLRSLI